MVAEGKTAEHISVVLGDMMQVLQDWRDDRVPMPAGNPWEWAKPDLEHFVSTRKSEW